MDTVSSDLPLEWITKTCAVYRAEKPGDLRALLTAIVLRPRLAEAIDKIELSPEFDNIENSGVLEFGRDNEWYVDLAQQAAETPANDDDSDVCSVISDCKSSDPGSIPSSHSSLADPDDQVQQNINQQQHNLLHSMWFDLVFSWLSSQMMWRGEGNGDPPLPLYLHILSALLSFCHKVRVLTIPETWLEGFDTKLFPRLITIRKT